MSKSNCNKYLKEVLPIKPKATSQLTKYKSIYRYRETKSVNKSFCLDSKALRKAVRFTITKEYTC